MAKYNVGVGDACPVDQPEKPPEAEPERGCGPRSGDDRAARERRRHYYRWNRSAPLFEATFVLLAIWGVLHLVNGYGPKGLLIAAGITFGVGVIQRLFWRSHWERREWREERRRRRAEGL
ncbi:MAG: hypothetical protein IT548_00155 [Alphaproteobacteria bacterium]|nr:hypothetical protein [Alphaproteobacteria bacterium]